MKKIIIMLLSLITVFTVISVSLYADESEKNKMLYTYEPSMPILSNDSKSDLNYRVSVLQKEREAWLNQVIKYNENLYGQSVSHYTEDSDKYTLYFEPKKEERKETIVYEYQLSKVEEIDQNKWGVSRIEYVKPESKLALSVMNDENTRSFIINGVTYDYKFTYYYAWSSGYYRIEKKSFSSYASIAASQLIKYTIDKLMEKVHWVIQLAAGTLFDSIELNLPIVAETYNKYFYENKVCSVKKQGSSTWFPTCQIGRRLSFGWCWSTARLKTTGEPTILKGPVKNGNGIPPTNYDSQAKKPYFDNNEWMIRKDVETMSTGGYADVYAICITLE